MTARSDDPEVSPATATAAAAGGEIWNSWEELVLAFAVKRHGTARWDLVAMELQSRSKTAADARFTPAGCRLRFRLLHRRFAAGAENGGVGVGGEDDDEELDAAVEWAEELRNLRLADLRREVERCDLSIGSLLSEVKRLKEEEKERSISGEGTPAVKDDKEEEAVLAKGSTEDDDLAGEDRVSGGESNFSDLKRLRHDAGTTTSAAGDDDAAAKEEEAAAATAPGKSGSVKQEEVSGESVAGSKEADAEKESSDVQSTASPSRRRKREGGGGEEAEADEAASPSTSATAALPAAEAEALSAFLESVRTSKSGSVFERRLASQDDANYRSTIRRHVDLETIRSKLEPGGTCYSSPSEFYRDLLLLCTNALVFFPRGSPEHAAAVQIRTLVTKHISAHLRKDQPSTSGKAAAASKKPKADADVGSLLEKTAPIIVCRKRSSIAKAALAAKAEKVEREESEEDEEENEVKRKVTAKDKTRGLRTNKTRGGLARKPGLNQRASKDSETESAAAEGSKKSDKKGGGGGAAAGGVAKKRNAVDFLNRMKQSTGPSTERVSLLETLKLSAAAEQKKAGKGEARRESGSGSGSKRGNKDNPPGRRIGRPPKRAAAPPTPPPSKRARGSGRRGGKK